MTFRGFHKKGVNPILTGPGVLVGAEVFEKLGGWPATGISEDIELSALLIKNNIKSKFCDDAIFYDEQANNIKTIFNQRLRWTKGMSHARKKYHRDMVRALRGPMRRSAKFLVIGMLPFGTIFSILTLLGLGASIALTIIFNTIWPAVGYSIGIFVLFTFPAWIQSIIAFWTERKRVKLSGWKKFIYILFSPFGSLIHFLADVVRHFIRVTWKPIPHGVSKKDKTIL